MQRIAQLSTNVSERFKSWTASPQIQALRQNDALVAGAGITGLMGIASVASWCLPWSNFSRFSITLLTAAMAKFYGGAQGATAVFTSYFPKAMELVRSQCKPVPQHSDTGFWIGRKRDVRWSQFFDPKLATEICNICTEKDYKSAWDFGCGPDLYSKELLLWGVGASGLDGNPSTSWLSNHRAIEQDLTKEFSREKRDLVISLEVGDKIPEKHARQFIQNIANHAGKAIIISWADKGQKGPNHLNPQNQEYVRKALSEHGWVLDQEATERLRNNSHPILYWHKNVMAFKKEET